MRFFTLIALLLAAVSTIFVAPVLLDYFATGLVDRFPTPFVCCFVYLAAMQALFTGVMLSTINQKDRHDYEMNLIYLDTEYKRMLEQKHD